MMITAAIQNHQTMVAIAGINSGRLYSNKIGVALFSGDLNPEDKLSPALISPLSLKPQRFNIAVTHDPF